MPFFGKITAEWKRIDDSQVIWRVPNDTYPKIKKIKSVLVKEFERVAFISKGRIVSVVGPGEYPLPKGTDEIIWVDVSPKTLPFGIAKYRRLLTKDGREIGLSGTLELVVGNTEADIRKFLAKLVADKTTLTYNELIEWLREGPLVPVFRDFLRGLTYGEILRLNYNSIEYGVIPKLTRELLKYGLELKSINVLGISLFKE